MESKTRFQIKIFFGSNNIRRYSFDKSPTWASFYETFKQLFRAEYNPNYTYKFEYVDPDGDRVVIDTEVEWQEMMHLFKNASITKLHVSEQKPRERQITPPRKEKQVADETKWDKKPHDLLYLEAEKQLSELKIKVREAREAREAETKARQDAHQKARQAREAELRAREEAEKNSFEEAHKAREAKVREEAEKKAHEQAEEKARDEAEKKARDEAEKKAIEAEESKKAQIKSEAEKNNAVVQKYTPQLHQLFELGFKDVSRNLKLLVTFNGRLEDVINTLLS